MIVRWLTSALAELERIYGYIVLENPKVARQVLLRIRRATRHLSRFPSSGRPGQIDCTRDLVVTGLPYVVVYRVTADTVEILRVVHTSMDMESHKLQ